MIVRIVDKMKIKNDLYIYKSINEKEKFIDITRTNLEVNRDVNVDYLESLFYNRTDFNIRVEAYMFDPSIVENNEKLYALYGGLRNDLIENIEIVNFFIGSST